MRRALCRLSFWGDALALAWAALATVGACVINTDPRLIAATIVAMERVHYLKEAGKFLGQGDLERIDQRGEDPGRSAMRFEPAPGFERLSA